MDKTLKDQELLLLEKYRLNPNLDDAFPVEQLVDKAILTDFLKKLADDIGAPSEKVAASIFIKRYAFIAVISLYAMTAWNKKINVSLDNVKMEAAVPHQNWLPSFTFNKLTVEDWSGENRSEWRDGVLKDLFANNVFLLIEQLEKTAGISKLILWENIAVYLFWLYETELKDMDPENDFRYLILEAKGQLFGRYNGNPLQKYFGDKKYVEELDLEIRIRKTCCFTYQLPAGKRCKTCPCTHLAKDGRCFDGESVCESVRGLA